MDCTFCLDCIHACPFDNVGITTRVPTAELWRDPFRSGIGRFSQRTDLTALVALLIFASFINAFAMIPPVYALREQLGRWLGGASATAELAIIFAIGLGLIPAALLALAGQATRRLAHLEHEPLLRVIGRYIYALAPLGFGMWLAHYSFHFLTGGLTIIPVAQSFLADIGLSGARPQWGLGQVVPGDWLFPIEAFSLYAGAFGSLLSVWKAAPPLSLRGRGGRGGEGLRAALPWMLLILLLLAVGLLILVQPMEIRGTFMAPGLR